jgi:hypothetical protein
LSLSIRPRSTFEILEGLFARISSSIACNWDIANALDFETSFFSFPGEMTARLPCLTGDSQGELGEETWEILRFYTGDWRSESSSLLIWRGLIDHEETFSGEIESWFLKCLKGLTISYMQISEFSLFTGLYKSTLLVEAT